MLSEKTYLIILILGFTGITLFIWLMLIPYGIVEYNLGVNLFTSSIFMVLTIVFLSWLFNLREKQEWKNVEALVNKRIGKYHYSLFDILARFIYPQIFRPHPNKEKVLEILKALNGTKKATLATHANQNYFSRPLDPLSEEQLEILFKLRKYIGNLEIKHSRFIKPKILMSLMEIENCLDIIEEDFNLFKKFPGSGKAVKEEIAKSILMIMKEIYKIHKMGIEIYPKQ